MDRRDCLRFGVAAGAGALLSGCPQAVRRYTAATPPSSVALPEDDVEPTTRLLNRVSFGPLPGEAARVQRLGAARYVDEQLNPSEGEDLSLTLRRRGIEAIRTPSSEMRDLMPEREVLQQLQQAALLRAVYSRH